MLIDPARIGTRTGHVALSGVNMNDEGKRALWKLHHDECSRLHAAWAERGYQYPPPARPPFPDVLRGLACGASTRAGTPCKMTAIYGNSRCKLHGGLSTGPTTAEGKAKAAQNGHAPKRKRTP